MPTVDVLILSPLAANRARLASWLAPLGLRCEAVADEAQLRGRLGRQRVDPPRLLLLDGHPAESCYPLVNRLFGEPALAEVPVLLLLDNLADDSRRLYGELLHGLDWLAKPLLPARLREQVLAAMELDSARRALEPVLPGPAGAGREGLLAVDATGRIRFASRQAARWLRLSPLGLCGLSLQSLLEAPVGGVDTAWAETPLADALGGRRALELPRLRLWRGDGGSLQTQALLLRTQAPGLALALVFHPAAGAGAPALAARARLDLLTGLPLRPILEESLAAALGAARPLALLLLDIDHLRHLNDTLGHDLGDLLLRAAAGRLREAGTGGVVASLGGGRFAVLCEGIADHREAGRLGRRLQALFRRPFLLQGHEVFCSVSLGIALAPAAGHDAPQLLQGATQALARAKALGRGGLQFTSALHNRLDGAALEREEALTAAVRGRRLGLAWRGWRGADGRLLAVQPRATWPGVARDVEALAEEAGMGPVVAEWCMRQALRQGLPATASLLLAPDPACLLEAQAPARLCARLRRKGLEPERVLCRIPWREAEAEAWARQLPRFAATGLGLALKPEGGVLDLRRLASVCPATLLVEEVELAGLAAERRAAVLAGLAAMAHALGWGLWWGPAPGGLARRAAFSAGAGACAEDFEFLPKMPDGFALPI